MRKPNINLYDHSEKVFRAVKKEHYESCRRGLFDFPSKEKWLKEEWEVFKSNHPELLGLVWDEENQDWKHEYEGGLIRTILQ